MENLSKMIKNLLTILLFFLGSLSVFAQDNFFVYKVDGTPYIEVNDSIKSVTKGSVLTQETLLTMTRDDVVQFINNSGDIFELYKTGTFSYSDLQRIPAHKSSTTLTQKLFAYVWKELTNSLAAHNKKSGVVYRGDAIVLMLHPADSIQIYNNEIRFEWQPIEGKEKDYYFMLRNVETGTITTIGTKDISLSLVVDDYLLKPGNRYEWTVTETKYPNLKKTPFYNFELLSEEEFKSKENDIKSITSSLKDLGYKPLEIREIICQDYKVCY